MKLFNNIKNKQEKIIQSLEGIGDVLLLDVKNRKDERVKKGLRIIHDLLFKLMQIRKISPEAFERLLLHQKFFQIYNENKEEARLRIVFSPEKYLIAFSSAVSQIIRVHQISLKERNEKTSRQAAYHLNWLISELSQEPDNEIFVKEALNSMNAMGVEAIKHDDPSIYAISVQWYPDIVFNRMRQPNELFRLEYLNIFDKYYFSSIKRIIHLGKMDIYKVFVSTMCEGFFIPSWDAGKLWDYGHLILRRDLNAYRELEDKYNIEKKLRLLVNSEADVNTIEKFNAWIKKYEEFKSIIDSHLLEEEKKVAKELDIKIRGYIDSQFKYSNLLEFLFAIGAYCVFKDKPEYIKYLWTYKQPDDSDALWCGHDIIPTNLVSLISRHFVFDLYERKIDFWEDHHGSEIYYNKYFILLLAKIIKALPKEKLEETLANFQLPKMDVFQLSNIEHNVDNSVGIAIKLSKNKEFISKLGFIEEENIKALFVDLILPFLKSLKIKAQKRILNIQREKNISVERIKEFKSEIIATFYKEVELRKIFKYLNKYIDRSGEEYEGAVEAMGINTVEDKAAYFDKWHISFVGWAENRGRQIATGEDQIILASIVSNCEKLGINNLDRVIRDEKNVIIISTFPGFYREIEDSGNFTPKYVPNVAEIPKVDGEEIECFQGWYKVDGNYVPVFYAWSRELEKGLLVLNRDKLGHFVQYNPLRAIDDTSLREDIFSINIQSFSENEALIAELLEKSPDWLKKIGSEKDQREHLKEKVWLRIYERFEFIPVDKQKFGYFLKITEK